MTRNFFYLFLLFTISLFANLENYIFKIQKIANDLNLSKERDWLLLLHYKNGFNKFESLIDDPQFFVSNFGKNDPESELNETIRSFFRDFYENGSDLSSQCIFVERFRWLDQKLNFDRSFLKEEKCDRFQNWYSEVNGDQIAIVFASSYMNNPSSMFGHTFLRIDKKQNETSLLLSYALNYSANTGNDGGFSFAFKGIFGGYPAYFSVSPYFEKIRLYNDLENRDLHEYILNFSKEEIRRLIYHLWELHFFKSDYFFFKENCSYNILTLLEYARPSLNLSDKFSAFTIPSDTIREISKNQLISNIFYRPSKKSEISHLLKFVTEKEKKAVLEIVEQKVSPENLLTDFNFSKTEKMNILDLAYQYVDYLRIKKSYDFENPKKLQMKILIARSKIGKREEPISKVEEPKYGVEDGHKVSRVSFGFAKLENLDFLSFEIKPSYHQISDNQSGYIDGAEISFFDLKTLFNSDEVLYSLDLLKIKSFTSYGEFFKPISWKFSTGVENRFELQKPILYLNSGAGFTFGNKMKIYSLLTLNYEYSKNYQKESFLFAGLNIGAFSSLNNFWRVVFDLSIENTLFYKNVFNREKMELLNNFSIDKDRSIILDLSFEKLQNIYNSEKLSLKYRYYW